MVTILSRSSVASALTMLSGLPQKLLLWFNENMTIVLVAFGSSLMATAMFLLSKATEASTMSWCYMSGALTCIVLSFIVWGWALRREWKRERVQEQERKAREQREMAREQREIEEHKHLEETRERVNLITPNKNNQST